VTITSQAFEFRPPIVLRKKAEQNPVGAYGVKIQHLPKPPDFRRLKPGAEFIFVDADTLRTDLRVRFRLPGESMAPLGMDGKRKSLKKILAEMKIPVGQRDFWPILVMGKEIVWIFRGPMSQVFKLTAATRRAAKIFIFKAN
jgi:tRNA(Ile)-lysidine synthetase-like protein